MFDIKNLGGPYAGAITAGKFLAHLQIILGFHIDMPGVYSKENTDIEEKGLTGMGSKISLQFLKKRYYHGTI